MSLAHAPAAERPHGIRSVARADAPAKTLAQSAFGRAIAADGSAAAAYGATAPGEAFAEACSLCITSPSVLKALHPAASAFLEMRLPK